MHIAWRTPLGMRRCHALRTAVSVPADPARQPGRHAMGPQFAGEPPKGRPSSCCIGGGEWGLALVQRGVAQCVCGQAAHLFGAPAAATSVRALLEGLPEPLWPLVHAVTHGPGDARVVAKRSNDSCIAADAVGRAVQRQELCSQGRLLGRKAGAAGGGAGVEESTCHKHAQLTLHKSHARAICVERQSWRLHRGVSGWAS